MAKINLYLPESERGLVDKVLMPRNVSISAIMRWLLLAAITPEKKFLEMRDASKEGTAVAEFLRGKIEKLTK
jgi:hypothetical protein